VSSMPTLYKCLGPERTACNGGTCQWLPPGEWMPPVQGPLVLCQNGYHLCEFKDILSWANAELWEAEGRGESIAEGDKIVFREARLVKRCEWWNERTARLFACDCAEHVLSFFEKAHPTDMCPRQCIEVTRRYANGEANGDELAAAGAAAWEAARAAMAAWEAARAAGDAARDAGATAGHADFAWAAAWEAARAAAGAAGAAAWDAGDAAGAAARATGAAARAAGAAAWDAGAAERLWQLDRLLHYAQQEGEKT